MTRADRIWVQAELADSAAADACSAEQWTEACQLHHAAEVLVELADELLMGAGW